MAYDKNEILELSIEERRNLAFELLESIDEDFIQKPIPEWKVKLIRERLADDNAHPETADAWSKVRKKYFG